jgi:hypothetical protein
MDLQLRRDLRKQQGEDWSKEPQDWMIVIGEKHFFLGRGRNPISLLAKNVVSNDVLYGSIVTFLESYYSDPANKTQDVKIPVSKKYPPEWRKKGFYHPAYAVIYGLMLGEEGHVHPSS